MQDRARRAGVFELGKHGLAELEALGRAFDAATPASVRRVAEEVLTPENRSIVVIAPPDRVDAVRAALADVIAASDRRAGAVVTAAEAPALGSFWIEPRADTTLCVFCLGFRDAGSRGEGAGRAGASSVLAAAFAAASGPAPFGGRLQWSSSRDALRVQVTCVGDLVHDWVERLAEHLAAPSDELFEQARAHALAHAAAAAADPEALVLDLAAQGQFGDGVLGRPARGLAEDLERLTPDDVRAHFVERIALDRLHAVGVGAVEPEPFRRAILGLASRLALPDEARPLGGTELVAPRGPQVLARDLEGAELFLAVSWRAMPAASADRAAMLVLDCALAWYGGRLFRALREERGDVYSLLTAETFGREAGAYTLTLATEPEAAPEVLATLGRIVGEVAASGLADDELARCVAACVGTEEIALAGTEALAEAAVMELELGEVPGRRRRLRDEVARVLGTDVARVAAEVFRAQGAVLAVAGPDATRRAGELGGALFRQGSR